MKKLILYDLKDKNNAERCKIIQSLFGYKDNSNKGQYFYERKGKLDQIKFEKKRSNILIFNSEKDRKKVINIFKGDKIKFMIANS